MTSVGDYTLLEPGAGPSIELGLGCPTIKVGKSAQGRVGVVDGEVSPGRGLQVLNRHQDPDELFYVVEGEIDFLLDGSWQRAAAGTTVFVPAGWRPARKPH